jgi:hypothetical protein
MRALASLGEARAVPFFAEHLRVNHKMHRTATIQAPGKTASTKSPNSLQVIANDKREIVQQALQQALGRQGEHDYA